MEYFDYSNLEEFLNDQEIIEALCINQSIDDLLDSLAKDDFLAIDGSLRIPFFAETRDYVGAAERDDSESVWIVKPVGDDDVQQTEMAMISYLVDFVTKTISAPVAITRIDGTLYRASRLIPKTEQMSGANYTEIKQLKEQLLLDLINRWIYYDEDRNPNNYMIRYNSKNDQIIIAIDFSNVDLISEETKISGVEDHFGWERQEKTRYLTPLKSENFLNYDMSFFNMRFREFANLDSGQLRKICRLALRFNSDRDRLSKVIADNIERRAAYVQQYFEAHFPLHQQVRVENKYKDMGKTFDSLYGSDK